MPSFIAPELNHANNYTDVEIGSGVDVWGAGMVMLRLATLKHPKHNEIKEAISTDLAVYSPGFREIINGCLQIDPSERWSGDQICEHNTLKDLV